MIKFFLIEAVPRAIYPGDGLIWLGKKIFQKTYSSRSPNKTPKKFPCLSCLAGTAHRAEPPRRRILKTANRISGKEIKTFSKNF